MKGAKKLNTDKTVRFHSSVQFKKFHSSVQCRKPFIRDNFIFRIELGKIRWFKFWDISLFSVAKGFIFITVLVKGGFTHCSRHQKLVSFQSLPQQFQIHYFC